MKGPVPMAFLAVCASFSLVKSCALVALFFSHHALLMMKFWLVIISSMVGLGTGVVNSTVWSSIFFGSPTALAYTRKFEVGPWPRLIENTTSSAVKSLPSWNLTPLRRVNTHVVGLVCFQVVARPGM